MFYWHLIPPGFPLQRMLLYPVTAYIAMAFIAAILTDLLITNPISDNWYVDEPRVHIYIGSNIVSRSIENQMNSIWNSFPNFTAEWGLNISSDLICMLKCPRRCWSRADMFLHQVFCFPFSILRELKLPRRQMIGIIGVFSLGAITMGVSTARFTAYTVTDFELADEIGSASPLAPLLKYTPPKLFK